MAVQSPKTYNITGRVNDGKTQQGIANLRVETWDSKLTFNDVIESATTDDDGNFKIVITETRLQACSIDALHPLFFKVFQQNSLLASTEDSILWDLRNVERSVLIEVSLNGSTSGTYKVFGQIREQDGTYFQAGVVRAFDKDMRTEQLLGQTITDSQGNYEITYSTEQFSKDDRKTADLIVRVQDSLGQLQAASPVIFNAEVEQRVNLVIGGKPYRGPSEYERFLNVIIPVSQGVALSDLTEQDVAFLTGETEIKSKYIAFIVVAARHAKKTGVAPEPFYGMFRMKLPTSLPALLSQSREAQRHAIQTAIKRNIIPFIHEEMIEQIIEQLRRAAVLLALNGSGQEAKTALGDILTTALADKDLQAEFLSMYSGYEGNVDTFWADLADHPTLKPFADDLQFTMQIGTLTRNHLPLVQHIQKMREGGQISSLKDLARLDVKDWEVILSTQIVNSIIGFPQGLPGEDEGEKQSNYAKTMTSMLEDAFPTAAIAARLEKDESTPLNKQALTSFFSNNPEFDFRSTHIDSYLAENSGAMNGIADKAAATSQLKTMQRVFKVAPKYSEMSLLIGDGLDSAQSIAKMAKNTFLFKYGETLGSQQAKSIYEGAAQASAVSMSLLAGFGAMFNDVSMQVLPSYNPPQLNGVPDLETLFGSLDLCECEHCRSIYSPAAYLVDTLHFLGQRPLIDHITGNQVFFKKKTSWLTGQIVDQVALDALIKSFRRPDITGIALTCENTNTVMPYVDLVNEILENAVQSFDFNLPLSFASDLDNSTLSPALKQAFISHLQPLSDQASIQVVSMGRVWLITDTGWTYSVKNGTSQLIVSRAPQTSRAAEELRVNPEHVNGHAYNKLSEQVYPWGLPFDLWIEEARVYLEHLGAPRHELMKTFQKPGATPDPTDVEVACEHLLITTVERKLITFGATNPVWKAWEYWGYPASPSPGGWNVTLKAIPAFLSRSALSYQELLELLKTKFINPDGTIIIESSDPLDPTTCDLEKLRFNNTLTGEELTLVHRFVRLWLKLGWSMRELDSAITVLQGSIPNRSMRLNDAFFVKLSLMQTLRNKLKLPIERLLSLWSNIDIDGENSLYQRLFLNPLVLKPVDMAFQLNGSELAIVASDPNGAKVSKHAPTILAALEITASELAAMTASGQADDSLTLANLSKLYRITILARALKISIKDTLTLISLTGINPFDKAHTEDTFKFVEAVKQVLASGFGVEELDYLLRHQPDASASIAPTEEVQALTLDDLRSGLQKIIQETTGGADQNGDLTQKKLSLLNWDEQLIKEAIATLAGNVVYEAALPGLPDGIVFTDDVKEKISYDEAALKLSFVGPMTEDEKASLLSASQDPVYQGAVANLYAPPRDFVSQKMKAFEMPTFSAPLNLLPQGVVFTDELKAKIYYDAPAKQLRFGGAMTGGEKAALLSLSSAVDYQAAINALFNDISNYTPDAENSFLSAVDAALLFGPPTTAEQRFALVLSKLLAHLRASLSEDLVKQKIGEALKLNATITEQLLTEWVRSPNHPMQKSIKEFLTPAFAESDSQVKLTADGFPDQFAALTLLQKVATVVSRFKISAAQLRWVFEYAPEAALLDLNSLPVESVQSVFFPPWLRMTRLFRLRDRLPQGETTLSEVFSLVKAGATVADILASLSKNTGWSLDELTFLAGNDCFAYSVSDWFMSQEALERLWESFLMMNRLGVSAAQCRAWTKPDLEEADARSIKQAAKAKYEESVWLSVAKPLRDQLRENQRAALVDYLIARPNPALGWNWKDANGLYEHFLIDVEMSPCQMTSRIKQAISSVQLFVQRSLMNLEPEVSANAQVDSKWLDWKWMKNYRVWEANHKVFLYPENWIEPDLRDDKSPFFKELENELLQNDVTMETAEAAFLSYLEKLDAVARLEICGMFHQIETDQPDGKGNVLVDVLHAFGRTRSLPHVYYYRRRVDSSYWTAWERVDLDIEGDHLIPVVWNRRLHLFWPMFKEEVEKQAITMPAANEKMAEAQRYLKIQIVWSEFKSGKWSAKKVSEEFLKTQSFPTEEPIDTNSITFKGLPQDGELIIRCYAQLEVPLEAGSGQKVMLMKQIEGGEDPGGSDPGDDYEEEVEEEDDKEEDWNPPYEEPTPTTTVTAALGEFKFTGCFGKILLRHQNQLGNLPYLVPPVGSAVENMGFVEYLNGAASDDKLHLFQLDAYDPSVPDDIVTLKQTPGKFRVLPPHQYAQFASQGPFFFQDDNRTFFVFPYYGRVISKWSIPDVVLPDITFDYYYGDVLMKDPAAPVINPGDAVRFEPSFSLDSKFTTYKTMNVLSAMYADPKAGSLTTFENKALKHGGGESIVTTGPSMYAELPTIVTIMLSETYLGYYTPMYATYVEQLFYRFEMFYHPYVCLFVKQLNRDGVDGLLQRRIQTEPESFSNPPAVVEFFNAAYKPKPVVATPYPKADVDFSHSGAYSQYNWELFFHSPLMIADRLSRNQRFEEAQRWFHYIFDPTDTSGYPVPQRYWRTRQFFNTTNAQYQNQQIQNLLSLLASGGSDPELVKQVQQWRKHPFNPHLIARLRTTAYQKNVVMKYIDNLISWGDQLFRRDTIESINEATQLYILSAEILGERPASIKPRATPKVQTYSSLEPKLDEFSNALVQIENIVPAPSPDSVVIAEGAPPATIPTMMYFSVPKNDKMLGYWDTVADRLFKIRHCMNIEGVVRQLPLFEPPIDPALLVKAVAAGVDIGSVLFATNAALPQYRFSVVAQKATELCSNLQSLGSALLSAMEKRDAEALSLLRSTQEIKVLSAARQVREKQVEEAKYALDGLHKSKEMIGARHQYYADIAFMNESEKAHLDKIGVTISMQAAQAMLDMTANALHLIPNLKVGAPTSAGATFGGDNIGAALRAFSSYLGTMISSISQSGSMNATMGSHQRRYDDWKLQERLAAKELEQLDKQIAAAEIRLAIAERELQNHDLQIENSKQTDEFMRDKFTNRELYDWMVSQISGVYFQSYQLAYDAAKRAERAYRFELGLEDSNFIGFGYWDSLKKGLLAGERLMHDIKRMEVAYLDQNKREYELVKNVSLALLDPIALIKLRESGECFVDLDESLFDSDYRGHYFRRTKSISLTVPCVTGPYTGVNCTLTLMQSSVRKNANTQGGYFRTGSEDNRFIDSTGAIQSIATSGAQNDSGMFEFNFRDERYLPFEGSGAISQWRIQLPKETNQFDLNSISDVILHLRYTARDGGEILKEAANSDADSVIPKSGVRLFSVKHEFSGDWYKFLHPADQQTDQTLTLDIKNDRFPFQFRDETIQVKSLEIMLKFKHELEDGDDTALQVYVIPPTESAAVLTEKNMLLEGDATLKKLIHSKKNYTAAKGLGAWSVLVKEIDIQATVALSEEVIANNVTHHRLKSEAIEDLWLVFHFIV